MTCQICNQEFESPSFWNKLGPQRPLHPIEQGTSQIHLICSDKWKGSLNKWVDTTGKVASLSTCLAGCIIGMRYRHPTLPLFLRVIIGGGIGGSFGWVIKHLYATPLEKKLIEKYSTQAVETTFMLKAQGDTSFEKKKYNEAIQSYNKYLDWATKNSHNSLERAEAIYHQGISYISMKDSRGVTALSIAHKISEDLFNSSSKDSLGAANTLFTNIESTIEKYFDNKWYCNEKEKNKLFINLNMNYNVSTKSNNIFNLENSVGILDLVICCLKEESTRKDITKAHIQDLKTRDSSLDMATHAKTFCESGLEHYNTWEWEKAYNDFKAALILNDKLAKEWGSKKEICFLRLKVDFADPTSNAYTEIDFFNNTFDLGNLYYKEKEYKIASIYFLNIYNKKGNKTLFGTHSLPKVCYYLADSYRHQKDYENALIYAQESKSEYKKLKKKQSADQAKKLITIIQKNLNSC